MWPCRQHLRSGSRATRGTSGVAQGFTQGIPQGDTHGDTQGDTQGETHGETQSDIWPVLAGTNSWTMGPQSNTVTPHLTINNRGHV